MCPTFGQIALSSEFYAVGMLRKNNEKVGYAATQPKIPISRQSICISEQSSIFSRLLMK